MPNLTSVGVASGVPNSGTGTVSTIDALMADGGQATIGAKADAKSTATDTTAVSAISIWKQISASVQAIATSIAGALSLASTARVASVSFTCGTTAYAAVDAVGASGAAAALQFASIGPSAASILITSASLEIDATAAISGETSYRLELYSVTPPSAINDSAAWDLVSGDRASYLGFINLGTPIDKGSTLYVATDSINKQLRLAGTDLFAYLITEGAYTPTARVFKIVLHSLAV